MKITTTIKQTLAQLTDQMKTSESWNYRHHSERENVAFLDDTDFNSSAMVETISEFEIMITTAWSKFVYIFREGEDGTVRVTYIGALAGYRQQNLMPHFTPTYETKCVSSEFDGVKSLTDAGLFKIRKALKRYPDEGTIGKVNNLIKVCNLTSVKVKHYFSMPYVNETCGVDVKVEGYPFPTKDLTWSELAKVMK